jgi:hypothetical protein
MRCSPVFVIMSVVGLAACAGPAPVSQMLEPQGAVMTGSRIEQDPAMKDPTLSLVYPSDSTAPAGNAGSILSHALWPFVQVSGNSR